MAGHPSLRSRQCRGQVSLEEMATGIRPSLELGEAMVRWNCMGCSFRGEGERGMWAQNATEWDSLRTGGVAGENLAAGGRVSVCERRGGSR